MSLLQRTEVYQKADHKHPAFRPSGVVTSELSEVVAQPLTHFPEVRHGVDLSHRRRPVRDRLGDRSQIYRRLYPPAAVAVDHRQHDSEHRPARAGAVAAFKDLHTDPAISVVPAVYVTSLSPTIPDRIKPMHISAATRSRVPR